MKYQWVREGDVLKRGGERHFYGHTQNSPVICLPHYTIFLPLVTKAPHLQVQGAQAEGQRPRDGIQQVVCQVEKLQLLQRLWGHKEWEIRGGHARLLA